MNIATAVSRGNRREVLGQVAPLTRVGAGLLTVPPPWRSQETGQNSQLYFYKLLTNYSATLQPCSLRGFHHQVVILGMALYIGANEGALGNDVEIVLAGIVEDVAR